jgi:hypothetical protein
VFDHQSLPQVGTLSPTEALLVAVGMDERLLQTNEQQFVRDWSCFNSKHGRFVERSIMSLGTILLIILILILVGALPTWPYSGEWGYYPSGGLGIVVIILLILLLLGRL